MVEASTEAKREQFKKSKTHGKFLIIIYPLKEQNQKMVIISIPLWVPNYIQSIFRA